MQKLWDKGHTPLNIDKLATLLVNYPDKEIGVELLEGFSNGFRLGYTGPRLHVMTHNLISAREHLTETLDKIQEEINLGRMLGPFKYLPISTLRISPIGVVPKSDGKWRLITHLSHPISKSVNTFIDPTICKVSFTSFDNILDKIYDCGSGAELAKVDIKSAFRLMPINPADFDLLGIYIDGRYYIDKCLPMGCSISCSLFEKFAKFLQYVVTEASGLNSLDHYLDDFMFIGSSGTQNCLRLMNTFQTICNQLGVPIAENKTQGPTTVITFLGLTIDTILMMVRIPEDKLEKLKSSLQYLLTRKKIFLKEFESLVGLLSFCSRAIPSSRAFIRRFYDLIASVGRKKPYYMLRVNWEVKADALLWLEFLDKFNGQCYFPERVWTSNEVLKLFTDSSGNSGLGCGAFFNGKWVQFRWPSSWVDSPILKNMTLLELIPVVLAMYLWAPLLKTKKIIFNIDNMALVSVVNKRTSKDKLVMKLIRPFVLQTMLNDIQFKSVYLPSSDNGIADSISRFQFQRFRSLAPHAEVHPEQIPVVFLELMSNLL